MEDGEIEALDDDIRKRTQTTSRQGRKDLNSAVAPDLRVKQGFFNLVCAEFLVLDTGLVGSHTFDHETLVFFAETFGAHGRVRQPPQDKEAPEDRCAAVGHE